MASKLKILFVEDVRTDAELIWHEIEKNNITFSGVVIDNEENYVEHLKIFEPDLIISDYALPQFDGMSALRLRNEYTPLTPFILVTGSVNEEIAVECMKAGADDYILKENLSRLGASITNSIKKLKLTKAKAIAEEELHKSELRLQKAQSIANVGNWELDLSSKLVWCSDEAKRIYGLSYEGHEIPYEIIKKSPLPEFRGMLDETLDRLLKYNETYEIEFEIKRVNDGTIRSIYSKAELVVEPDYEQVKVIGVIQDITERKKNERELIHAKEKAEESDRLKTAFLHNISHEIRTPMNAIVGFSALLGEPDVDENSKKSYIEIIMQSSNHLLSIITDIVDISNIEANLIKTVKNEVNINSMLKSLCSQFFPKSYEKRIDLSWETSLKETDSLILTDRTKLTQILSNMISNALKFTDKGSINVTCKPVNNFLEFSVSDTGIGIPSQYHNRVFDRFFQVQNNVKRLYEGTGLGLTISRAYIKLLGGDIWLSSEPGKGTTFFFTIPYEKVVPKTVSLQEKKTPDNFVFPSKKVILVAEDIESNFKLIKYFLSGANTELLHANNGKEAVERCLSGESIDLILMDIKMPVMDGYTAVKLIREKNIQIPIIAQTAYADDREKAFECGCTGFISKPFDKKSLFKVLCEFI
jgi:PAS domain S-box-containing protein